MNAAVDSALVGLDLFLLVNFVTQCEVLHYCNITLNRRRDDVQNCINYYSI